MLARLGPRSGEVAAFDLGDIDWRAGGILVRGKARRQDRPPLPVEVGEALVTYLESYCTPVDGKWIFTTTSLVKRHKDFAS